MKSRLFWLILWLCREWGNGDTHSFHTCYVHVQALLVPSSCNWDTIISFSQTSKLSSQKWFLGLSLGASGDSENLCFHSPTSAPLWLLSIALHLLRKTSQGDEPNFTALTLPPEVLGWAGAPQLICRILLELHFCHAWLTSWSSLKQHMREREQEQKVVRQGGKDRSGEMNMGNEWPFYLDENSSSKQAVICLLKHCLLLLIYKLYVAFF